MKFKKNLFLVLFFTIFTLGLASTGLGIELIIEIAKLLAPGKIIALFLLLPLISFSIGVLVKTGKKIKLYTKHTHEIFKTELEAKVKHQQATIDKKIALENAFKQKQLEAQHKVDLEELKTEHENALQAEIKARNKQNTKSQEKATKPQKQITVEGKNK